MIPFEMILYKERGILMVRLEIFDDTGATHATIQEFEVQELSLYPACWSTSGQELFHVGA